jgi:hypothetical protein
MLFEVFGAMDFLRIGLREELILLEVNLGGGSRVVEVRWVGLYVSLGFVLGKQTRVRGVL